jgi:uncharacterized protein (DUF433 family)
MTVAYTTARERAVQVEIAPRIVVNPEVRFGKPVIKGTRVPVALVIAQLAGGMGSDEVAEEYGITPEDVRAALAYAADLLESEAVRAVP